MTTEEKRNKRRKYFREWERQDRIKHPEKYKKKYKKLYAIHGAKWRARHRVWMQLNREDQLLKKKEWDQRNSGHIKEYSRKYHAANAKTRSAAFRKWKLANPDWHKQYSIENRDQYAERSRNNAARRRNAEGTHGKADVAEILLRQNGRCANSFCEEQFPLTGSHRYHVDHIMPIALGGTNWPYNLQLLCPPCNYAKRAYHPDEWISIIAKESVEVRLSQPKAAVTDSPVKIHPPAAAIPNQLVLAGWE